MQNIVTFDARHNKPRIGHVLMACGHDATDVAIVTRSPLYAREFQGDYLRHVGCPRPSVMHRLPTHSGEALHVRLWPEADDLGIAASRQYTGRAANIAATAESDP
jgi:hypothetical protein